MSPEYMDICRKAAARLSAAQRAAPYPSDIYVWAVFTTAQRDGWIHIGHEAPVGVPLGGFEIVRPNECYRTWGSVAYSCQARMLMDAMRSTPILPIPRAVAA